MKRGFFEADSPDFGKPRSPSQPRLSDNRAPVEENKIMCNCNPYGNEADLAARHSGDFMQGFLCPGPPLSTDVLSCILDNIHLRVIMAGGSSFRPPWGIRVGNGMAGFYVVVCGRCWLQLDGVEPALALSSGDLAVLLHRKGHCLRDDLQSDVVPVEQLFISAHVPKRKVLPAGGTGTQTTLVCGSFTCEEDELVPLLPMLPPVIHVKSEDGHIAPWLNKTLHMFADELATDHPGTQTIINHLAHVVFVQGVRAYLATQPHACGKWLEAVIHREIGPAIGLIHTRPEEPWSVASLAKKSGMSRSAFAEKFTVMVGQSPMRYLLEHRMYRASKLLRQGHLSLKEISVLVGYGSEPAFSNAFKRWSGIAPGVYRRSCLYQDGATTSQNTQSALSAPHAGKANVWQSVRPAR